MKYKCVNKKRIEQISLESSSQAHNLACAPGQKKRLLRQG